MLPYMIGGVVAVLAFVLGGLFGYQRRRATAEREIGSAEEEAKRIVNEAYKSAESKKREALVEAKEEILKARNEYEREEKERRADLQKQERRLQQKEENLDRKTENMERKEEHLSNRLAKLEATQAEAEEIKQSQMEVLERISGFTAEEAKAETEQQLNCYADFAEHDLCIPVLKGRKTDKEKFAGAEATYTIEAMMKDGKALQSGTSHYFGDKFSRAYDVTFTGRDNTLQYPFQTSWGASTRLIGAIIMTHGDDDGLILPPAIAPIQVVIVPVAAHKPGVLDKCRELAAEIGQYARVKLDDSDKQPGWKFAQWEMKGVPVRLEIGPRDIENGQCVLVRRDTREKQFVKFEDLATAIPAAMEALAKDLYERALQNRERRTYSATTMDEVKQIAKEHTGFIKTMWCGDLACEEAMKSEAGLSSRCMPFAQEQLSDVCPVCGKPAQKMVVWGVAY